MKNQSIAEIKQILKQETVADDIIEALKLDTRKGVQQALKVYYNRLAKKQLLLDQLYEMKSYERNYYQQGKTLIAGIDEVGRGPLAGPETAAAILPGDFNLIGLTDSKKLSVAQREQYAEIIKEQAIAVEL